MAYLTLIAAVPEWQIDAFRIDERIVLTPSLVRGVSHLLGYGAPDQPWDQVVSRAIDGGELLTVTLWHPLRPPMVHRSADVASLVDQLTTRWRSFVEDAELHDEWYSSEVNRLLEVMSHARDNAEAVVSALVCPADEERAKHVRIPWFPHSELHDKSPRHWLLPGRR